MIIDRIRLNPEKPGHPYCQGVVAEGKFLFVAGHGPWCPERKEFVRGTVGEQTTLALKCLERVILAAGGKLENVVTARVFLSQLTETNFAAMNVAYQAFFGDARHARTTVGTQLLNFDVEIDCVVAL